MSSIKMKYFLSIVIFLNFFCSGVSQSQFQVRIIDSKNKTPIANTNILIGDTGFITDINGILVVQNPIYPLIVEISHLNYHDKTVIILSALESGMTIDLTSKTYNIEEINILTDRNNRFFRDQYYYITDYLLLNQNIITIGYDKNRLFAGRMTLVDQNQKILSNLPITKPKKLFRDGYGNVHLFAGDSVYQVYLNNNQIYLIYPTHVKDFAEDLLKFQFKLGHYFVFKEISGEGQANEYYAIDTVGQKRINIETIFEKILFSSEEAAVRYRQWHPRLRGKISKNPAAANALFEIYVYDLFLLHKSVNSQIFKYKEGLVLFDLANNQTFIYNQHLEQVKKVTNNFPKHNTKRKQIIHDSITNKFYWIYYHGSKVLLGEIDIDSGDIVDVVETPSLPFIENIQICDEIIWYLYQPRFGEKVQSLYKLRK